MTPAINLHMAEKYDLLGARLPDSVRRVGVLSAMRLLVGAEQRTLELPEPLWMRFLPTWTVLAVTWKAAGAVRRRPRRIVTYAMEVTPFRTLLAGDTHLPKPVVRLAAAIVGRLTAHFVDRICFASPTSAALYRSLPHVADIEHETFLELPQPNRVHVDRTGPSMAFVGALERRSGLEPLMRAWERVETALPDARLTVIGGGPLLDDVRRWAGGRPETRRVLGPLPRPTALEHISTTRALVAPSLPDGRWREQIGLPIKEALAAGATVVTTRQTGLADHLEQTGHHVLDIDDELVPRLESALIAALTSPLSRASVLEALPDTDGRLTSDHWLHHGPTTQETS